MDPFTNDLETRRRSPGWLRAFEQPALHSLALRLRRKFWEGRTSVKEDWLLDVALSELEYRHRRAVRTPQERPCCCELCMGPFDLLGTDYEPQDPYRATSSEDY